MEMNHNEIDAKLQSIQFQISHQQDKMRMIFMELEQKLKSTNK